MSERISPEVSFLLLVLALFLLPKVLQRFRLPAAITAVGLGAGLGLGLGAFQHDPTLGWLGTLGIVALFLFAGLEVDFDELRRGRRVVLQHVAIQTAVLVCASVACAASLRLPDRAAVVLALALFTPSTGFIIDSLGSFGLDAEQRFWVKSKAIAAEMVALGILFFTVQSSDVATLSLSTVALVGLVAVLPWVFRVFSQRILPHAPRSEFTFLVVVAVLSAYLTRKLGVYYLVGAFVVGITAVRMRTSLPGLVTEKVLGAVELFASFFVPFYFLKAGLHLERADFTLRSVLLGLSFVAVAVPVRVLTVALHRRVVLGESLRAGGRVGLSLVPTLVFTLVLANMLVERYAVDRTIHGALVVFAIVNTMLPGFLLRARLEIDGTYDAEAPATDPAAEAASPQFAPTQGAEAGPSQAPPRIAAAVMRAHDGLTDGRTHARVFAGTLRALERNAGRTWVEYAAAGAAIGLGIVKDSPGLVFAGTLVCPAFGQLGAFSLGLAAASPLLALRGVARLVGGLTVMASVVAGVARVLPPMSAPSVALPHAPTLFDVAASAVGGALVVLSTITRPSPGATAAGRAVFGQVSLVPLALAAYALSTGAWRAVGLSAWAVLTTLSALVVAALAGFVALGYSRIETSATEDATLEAAGALERALIHPARAYFVGRRGMFVRVAMPSVIVAAAAIPLVRTFESARANARTRAVVADVLDDLPTRLLDRRVVLGPELVTIQLTQVGDDVLARETEDRVRRVLVERLDRPIAVDVVSVPDTVTLEALALELRALPSRERESIADRRRLLRRAREQLEREPTIRHVLALEATTSEEATVVHASFISTAPNEPLDARVAGALEGDGFPSVVVRGAAFPARRPIDLLDELGASALVAELRAAQRVPGLVACVTLPALGPGRADRAQRAVRDALERSLRADGSAQLAVGEPAVVYTTGACPNP